MEVIFMVEESVRKRAPRKTVRKAVARTASVKRAPRTKNVAEEENFTAPVKRPRRKAPTLVAAATASAVRSRTFTYIGIGAFLVLFVIGAVIGLTDKGTINVHSIIDMRIESASPEDKVRFEKAQNASQGTPVVDGGLTPTNAPPPMLEPPEIATSTDATASSTEDGLTREAVVSDDEASSSEEVPATDSEPAATETIEG